MNDLIKMHEEIFGIAPVIIGLHWHDIEDRLIEAMETGVAYNEERELTTAELVDYRAGKLDF
jgi:DNA repair photolyase